MQWMLPALTLLGVITVFVQVSKAHAHIVEHIDRQINHLKRVIAMSAQDTINTIVNQLGKAKGELTSALADAQAQIAAAGVAAEVDLSALEAVAQALDDIVPDPVVVEEPTVDPVVVEEPPVE